jgi:hypothetical protein
MATTTTTRATKATAPRKAAAPVEPAKGREARRTAAKKAVATKPVVQAKPVPTSEQIAAMDRIERLAAAKPERAALAAWKSAGRKGPRPVTPIFDWMEDPANNGVTAPKSSKARTGASKGHRNGEKVTRTSEQEARLVAILTKAHRDGDKWHQAAKTLTAEAIPTSRGGGWYYSTVAGIASRMTFKK